MKYTMSIKPGSNIRLVTEIDLARERIHVKSTTVYDVNGSFIMLAQTDPPVLKSMLHKEVIVTYLNHGKNGMARYGFPAKIMDFVDNYKLSQSQEVRAVLVSKKGEPTPYSIRMFFRVEPTSQSNLTMTVEYNDVNVLDISLGGAKFSHGRRLLLNPNTIVGITIGIDGKIHQLQARILRTWEPDNERLRGELRFTSAEFLHMDKTVEHELSRKIHQIQTEGRLKEVYP
jgi:hypothetical protein